VKLIIITIAIKLYQSIKVALAAELL